MSLLQANTDLKWRSMRPSVGDSAPCLLCTLRMMKGSFSSMWCLKSSSVCSISKKSWSSGPACNDICPAF